MNVCKNIDQTRYHFHLNNCNEIKYSMGLYLERKFDFTDFSFKWVMSSKLNPFALEFFGKITHFICFQFQWKNSLTLTAFINYKWNLD